MYRYPVSLSAAQLSALHNAALRFHEHTSAEARNRVAAAASGSVPLALTLDEFAAFVSACRHACALCVPLSAEHIALRDISCVLMDRLRHSAPALCNE